MDFVVIFVVIKVWELLVYLGLGAFNPLFSSGSQISDLGLDVLRDILRNYLQSSSRSQRHKNAKPYRVHRIQSLLNTLISMYLSPFKINKAE